MQYAVEQRGQSANKAAIFIDFENICYHLQNTWLNPPNVYDCVIEILRNLKLHLQEGHSLDTILMKAYADFERMATAPLGSLYLMGIDTHNVLGNEHKNAADMRLSIDLMEVLYTRPDIQYFILVAGDRDYIPVVQHLRRQGRKVLAVAFAEGLSGDLLEIVGKQNVLEANSFLSEARQNSLISHRYNTVNSVGIKVVGKIDLPDAKGKLPPKDAAAEAAGKEESSKAPAAATKAVKKEKPVATPPKEAFETIRKLTSAHQRRCLEVLLRFVVERNLKEVWLSPFLRRLTDELPLLADWERKSAISDLEHCGAIAVESRQGDNYPYSVVLINYNHPDVVEIMP